MLAVSFLLASLIVPAQPETRLLELRGRILLPSEYRQRVARVALYSVGTPFLARTLVFHRGLFKFRKLIPGSYTLAVVVRGKGEIRQTVDVGPSAADSEGRVYLELNFDGSVLQPGPPPGTMVSVRQLSVPDKAWDEYRKAQDRLGKHDVPGALEHLQKAAAIAPQYSEAWNMLGTIEHQTGNFGKAEEYFRRALEANPNDFQATVNLGGTLMAQRKLLEALPYNRKAVEARPQEPLAQCQLGWNYLNLGRMDDALPYFVAAKKADPRHFCHPQLGLAEAYSRRFESAKAAAELEEHLRLHPDDSDAPRIRDAIKKMK